VEHQEHEIVDLKLFINSQYMTVDKHIDFLGTIVRPDFESGIEKLNQIYEEVNKGYDEERQRMIESEKKLLEKITAAMKTLLDEMETRRSETLKSLTDLKTEMETKLRAIDKLIDKFEAAKKSLEDLLAIIFDESLLDMEHSVTIAVPLYVSPRKWDVNVGVLKR
jgi:DNA repair exonuclease SbcCD ATPase subunit